MDSPPWVMGSVQLCPSLEGTENNCSSRARTEVFMKFLHPQWDHLKMAQRARFHGSSSARRVMRLLRGGLADETIIKAYAKPHQPKLTGSEESERQTDLREIRAATHDTFIRSSKAMPWNHVVYVDDHGLVLQKMGSTASSGSQVLLKKATNWKQQSSCCSCS